MHIGCVVINYQSAALICDLLASLKIQNDNSSMVTLVVDNDSQDQSVAMIASAIRELGIGNRVSVTETGRNSGFGGGNNFGVNRLPSVFGCPDLYWFLNPDTLANDTGLDLALDWFQRDPKVGIVGTGMVDGTGKPDLAGHRDPSPIGEFVQNAGAFGVLRRWSVSDPSLDRSGLVDWVSGASLLIRTSVFEKLGGFDEGFFLYFEEVDLCRRARNAGWKVIYEPRSRIVHLEGKTTGIEKAKPMPKYWYNSRRRFFVKHYGVAGLWAADLAWTVGRGIGMLRGRGPSSCRGLELWRGDLPVLLGREKLDPKHIRG